MTNFLKHLSLHVLIGTIAGVLFALFIHVVNKRVHKCKQQTQNSELTND